MCHSCTKPASVDALREAAFNVLKAVDEGLPAAAPSRSLALATLRAVVPDTGPWLLAVAVLEGGIYRTRYAVELAGVALDATCDVSETGSPNRESTPKGGI